MNNIFQNEINKKFQGIMKIYIIIKYIIEFK